MSKLMWADLCPCHLYDIRAFHSTIDFFHHFAQHRQGTLHLLRIDAICHAEISGTAEGIRRNEHQIVLQRFLTKCYRVCFRGFREDVKGSFRLHNLEATVRQAFVEQVAVLFHRRRNRRSGRAPSIPPAASGTSGSYGRFPSKSVRTYLRSPPHTDTPD